MLQMLYFQTISINIKSCENTPLYTPYKQLLCCNVIVNVKVMFMFWELLPIWATSKEYNVARMGLETSSCLYTLLYNVVM